MRFKLDENLPREAAQTLSNAGHDALTIHDQKMDWAIIALSALVGAGAIADAAGLAPLVSLILFVALALVGMLVQGKQLVRTPEPSEQ